MLFQPDMKPAFWNRWTLGLDFGPGKAGPIFGLKSQSRVQYLRVQRFQDAETCNPSFNYIVRTYPALVEEPCVKIRFKNKMQN